MEEIINKMISATNKKIVNEDQAVDIIKEYYLQHGLTTMLDRDIIYYKIAICLHNKEKFSLDANYLKSIHYSLFNGVLKDAGEYRQRNISKREDCLHFRSAIYSPFDMIEQNLNYDLEQEKNSNYYRKTITQRVEQLSYFVSHIWQAHPFSDGNTRTDMVFLQKYLKYKDIYHDNRIFDKNFAYFRNALVRSNYNTIGWIEPTYEYLNKFMYNFLLGNIELLDINETFVPEEKMIIKHQ